MNRDRIIGAAKQAKGTITGAVGRMLGNTKLEADGRGAEIEGIAQNAIGRCTDALKHEYRQGNQTCFRLRSVFGSPTELRSKSI